MYASIRPDERVARSHLGCEAALLPLAHQHDRPLHGREQALFGGEDPRQRARLVEPAHHHRERLLVALLALAQARDRVGRGGVAGEVVATQALDRDDPPVAQGARGLRDGLAGSRVTETVQEPNPWAARGAGVRLGMEAAVERVVVLASALGAHGERRHGGGRPVVGSVTRNRVARPAARAVGEGVEVAPVGGVEDLRETLRTGRELGRDRDAPRPVVAACDDREVRDRLDADAPLPKLEDAGGGRRLLPDALHEATERRRAAERLDRHARAVVANATADAFLARQPVDPGAEADSLDGSAHLDAATRYDRARLQGGCQRNSPLRLTYAHRVLRNARPAPPARWTISTDPDEPAEVASARHVGVRNCGPRSPEAGPSVLLAFSIR